MGYSAAGRAMFYYYNPYNTCYKFYSYDYDTLLPTELDTTGPWDSVAKPVPVLVVMIGNCGPMSQVVEGESVSGLLAMIVNNSKDVCVCGSGYLAVV